MDTKQFLIVIAVLVLGIIVLAHAQTYGALSFGEIAPTVVDCPAGSTGMVTLCGVGTTAPYTLYVAYGTDPYSALSGIIGSKLTGPLVCQPDKNQSIASGFTATCSFTIVGVQ
jgi:hypothetical protein